MSERFWLVVALFISSGFIHCANGQVTSNELVSRTFGSPAFLETSSGYISAAPDARAYFQHGRVIYRVGRVPISLEFVDSQSGANPHGENRGSTVFNYLVGSRENDWMTNLPAYNEVVYSQIYPKIDARYDFARGRLKSEFVVAAGGDPGRIRLRYSGMGTPRLDSEGALIFSTPGGQLREERPDAFQWSGNQRIEVPARFRITPEGLVTFELGAYDPTRPLTIDPLLVYSTLFGGHADTVATAVATDSNGNVYVTGWTDSLDLPLSGPVQASEAGSVDAFVLKLNPAGNTVLYATYFGGSGDDRAYGIAVDGAGNAFITGSTTSANFPMRSAIQNKLSGSRDAFVMKLNPAGNATVFSTYLGGSGTDYGYAIALDSQANAYVTGDTTSTDFPTRTPFQASFKGAQDAFVTKLSSLGVLVYSTYLGGSATEHATAIAVDSAGNSYVTGGTYSTNFPILNAFQSTNAGGQDAFVTKLNASGSGLVYSTYLGGSSGMLGAPEWGAGIAVDQQGRAYVVGTTSSMNFPVLGALQPGPGGGTTNAFVTALNSFGSGLVYSTYFGGSNMDYGQAIALDSSGNVYFAGYSGSTDIPLVAPAQSFLAGGYDAFVASLNSSGNNLTLSTYYGGNGLDSANGIAVDPSGNIYVAGQTTSSNFPTVAGLQSSMVGVLEGFILELHPTIAQADFSLAISPPSSTIPAGGSTNYTVTATALNGFGGTVNLSVTGLPANVTGSFTPSSITGSGSATLKITAASGASASSSTPSITGISGSISHVTSASLTVTAVTGPSVSAVSMSPNGGSGSSVTLSEVYSDSAGGGDITKVWTFLRSSYASSPTDHACYVLWDKATNLVLLDNDAGNSFGTGKTLGQSGTLSNSQCTVDVGASSVGVSGNNLTLNLALSFTAGFAGTQQIWMYANNASINSGWVQTGTFTVTTQSQPPPPPPVNPGITAVSVSPNAGSGSSGTLSEVYTDSAGGGDITKVWTFLRSSYASSPTDHACYVLWDKATNLVLLDNDAGNSFGAGKLLGQSGTLSNSQCSLNVGASSASVSGNTLTLNLALTFTAGFAGTQQIWMYANNASLNSGWVQTGSWTVPTSLGSQAPPPAQPISATSVAPNSGSGMSVTLSEAYTDTAGGGDITKVWTFLRSSYASSPTDHACYVLWDRATNLMLLDNDAGNSFGTGKLLGQSGTLSNSQCTLNVGASSVSVSGNTLTLNLALTFTAGFGGTQQIWMYANNATLNSGWVQTGSFTVQ